MKIIFIILVSIMTTSCVHQSNIIHKEELYKPETKYVRFNKIVSEIEMDEVYVNNEKVGLFERKRPGSDIVGRIDKSNQWLVIEDGVNGDSYPDVSIFRLKRGKMYPTKMLTRLHKELPDDPHQVAPDPFFLGFNKFGYPVVFLGTQDFVIKN
jgi:hypothetical protein